tara:strand:+ start:147 stop:377 length:231 start_codon:yes stop_codon:yes gene_type:complete
MKNTIFTPSGVTSVDFTDAEIKDAETRKTEGEAYLKAKSDYKAKVKADKEAGNTKLLSLGLTQDQVTALTGYDPNE